MTAEDPELNWTRYQKGFEQIGLNFSTWQSTARYSEQSSPLDW